ncbi:MAG: PAS domain S-box protein [Gemmatimonadota bacterium]|nr:MAG: PAS domain S-box protein [Gemmatimonadota bacterium]
MQDERKTKKQLLEELTQLRGRVDELQGLESERDRIEAALKESEARLRQIIDLVPHMIFVKDWHGRFLLANKTVADAYGTTVAKLTGTRHSEHHADEDELKHMLSDDQEVITEGVPKFIPEESFVDARGKQRLLQTIKIPFSLSGMDQRAVLGVALDITERTHAERERRRLEARIQRAQKQESLAALASGIAHNYHEVVMSILDNAALARAIRSPEGRELLGNIEKAARRAADLTNQMLVYAGEVRFEVCALFLNRLVEDMAHVIEAVISEKCELKYDLSADSLPIMADPGRLRQVVMNLTTNASEALANQPGTITLRTGMVQADRDYLDSAYVNDDLPEGSYAFLEVTDSGYGMDAEEQSKMFDPVFSRKFTEGGLGLAAVLGVVRGHNGTIKVESKRGSGTTVRVLLPTPPPVPFSGTAAQELENS